MNLNELADFIAEGLNVVKIDKWDMAPESYDFEIRHREANLSVAAVKSLILDFFAQKSARAA